MTATVTHINAGITGKMQQELEKWIGWEPWPRIGGVRHAAYGVFAEFQKFAALVIVHPDENSQPIPDGIFVNITEDEGRAIARSYGVDLNAYRYDTAFAERNEADPMFGKPLAQAMGMAIVRLPEPPPPLEVQYRSWRHGLIYERMQEIGWAQHRAWQACWNDDGVLLREPAFNSEEVERLYRAAYDHLYDNNLDAAERCCEQGEVELLRGSVDITARPQAACRPRRRRRTQVT